VQADRRALNITLNSIGTEVTRDERRKLYSDFGLLHPHGHMELAVAEDFDQIRAAMEKARRRTLALAPRPSCPAAAAGFAHGLRLPAAGRACVHVAGVIAGPCVALASEERDR
jgi:ATP synthase (C/AC39) subunit